MPPLDVEPLLAAVEVPVLAAVDVPVL